MTSWTHPTSSIPWVTTGTKRQNIVLFHLFFLCIQPFDKKLGSSLMYSFYLYTTIRSKYYVFLQLFFHFYTTIRPKLRVSLIYLFHLHKTIRQIYMILFHLFFLCGRPFDEKLGSSLIYFCLFTHDHSTKIYDPLSFILSLWMAIRPKIRALINLFLLFGHYHYH